MSSSRKGVQEVGEKELHPVLNYSECRGLNNRKKKNF